MNATHSLDLLNRSVDPHRSEASETLWQADGESFFPEISLSGSLLSTAEWVDPKEGWPWKEHLS